MTVPRAIRNEWMVAAIMATMCLGTSPAVAQAPYAPPSGSAAQRQQQLWQQRQQEQRQRQQQQQWQRQQRQPPQAQQPWQHQQPAHRGSPPPAYQATPPGQSPPAPVVDPNAPSGLVFGPPTGPRLAPNEVPPPERVVAEMRGFSDRDSAARASGALLVMNHFATLKSAQMGRAYTEKRLEVEQAEIARYEHGEANFGGCQSLYYQWPQFWRVVLDRYFTPDFIDKNALPGTMWRQMLAIPAGTVQPLPNAAAIPRACADDMAARARHETLVTQKRQQEEQKRAVAAATKADDQAVLQAVRADVAKASKARPRRVDTTVFGLALGEPLDLPHCPGKFTTLDLTGPCKRVGAAPTDGLDLLTEALSGLLDACRTAGKADSKVEIYFPFGKLPNGTMSLVVDMRAGVAIGFRVYSELTKEFVDALQGKYGRKDPRNTKVFSNVYGKTSEADEYEWSLEGLHVEFTLNRRQDDGYGHHGCLLVEPDSFHKVKKGDEDKRKAGQVKL
jgi:hypothetical protein